MVRAAIMTVEGADLQRGRQEARNRELLARAERLAYEDAVARNHRDINETMNPIVGFDRKIVSFFFI